MTAPDDAEPGSHASSVLDREAAARADASAAALGRYRHRMRRRRAIYYPVVGAIVLALVIAFTVAYLHGEVHNVRLVTVSDPPASLAVQTPSADQQQVWHTSDRAALGDPSYGGTVVVWGGRTVRGVNARTGRQTWSYYRSDRTVCTAAQIDGIAVAVYELAGNCDELTALDAATGRRVWTRTLDSNGQTLNGVPTFQADVADRALMMTTPDVIYSVEVGKDQFGDGEDHFSYSHFGCRINGAVLGSQGALISQTCAHPRCGSGDSRLKFCGAGPQLLLRGDPDEDEDSSNDTNPNRISWNDLGDTDVPVSGGEVLAAGNRTTGELDLLGGTKGRPAGSLDLGVAGSVWTAGTSSIDVGNGGVLVTAGGRTALVRSGRAKPVWTSASGGPPTVSKDVVVVPGAAGARLVDRATGARRHAYPLRPAVPRGATLYRLGSGFLAASTSGTTAYS
ncbi:PQQ-binding-like beta-propeller repeat protein [Jatrophihabitans endophyticus]|uniref:outer membrane protein assembly factor BamB family protein n=1 Tax=Jatrophihabitans endophyticus TaxID=1206085 RepID=UPI0019ED354E|nr:PQQ-binding-like beta-propeller repeat protein [Jatrophihabitans endophyticus]MBE7189475.1 PQQ-binding-like beta-propeller repeat protein [Jatrophihabitans endophyticus]